MNRLTESLKFIEDYIRFSTADRKTLARVRRTRGHFRDLKKGLPLAAILPYRDSAHDAGRPPGFDRAAYRTPQEMLIANFSRAKESARILEEVLKLTSRSQSRSAKAIRFQLYDFEKELFASLNRPFDPRLHVILDESYIAGMERPSVARTVRILADHGATMVQLRMMNVPDAEFLRLACLVRETLRDRRIALIVNNRCDIALAAGADGVHVGSGDLPVAAVRSMAGPRFIIGASARSVAAARRAEKAGADYLGVGALFPTSTKPDARPCSIGTFKRICRLVSIPVIGIGGINAGNYRTVLRAGAAGIAVASYLYTGDLSRRLHALTRFNISI